MAIDAFRFVKKYVIFSIEPYIAVIKFTNSFIICEPVNTSYALLSSILRIDLAMNASLLALNAFSVNRR